MYNVICPALGNPIRIKNIVTKNYEVPGRKKNNSTKCIEYIVVGNYREWIDYAVVDDFLAVNPDFDIEEATNGN